MEQLIEFSIYLVLLTAFYTLMAVRISFVYYRASQSLGLAVFIGVVWPMSIIVVGFMITMSGQLPEVFKKKT